MMGALIMTVTKRAAEGGALTIMRSGGKAPKVGICVDDELTAVPRGLASFPQRSPRKTCARSDPRSRPRTYLFAVRQPMS